MSAGNLTSSPMGESLLEGLEAAPAPAVAVKVRPKRPNPLRPLWDNKRVRYALLAVLVIGGGLGAFFLLRPVPQPDYALAPMDEVLDYTLLTEDFNKLPVDKRLDLIRQLIERLKTMSGDDSMMMAMFAAGIDTDKLREQLMRNAALVAIDVWDQKAIDYQKVPTENREAYLDSLFLDMTKLLETMAGVSSTKSDEERLEEARDQAKKDQDMFATGKGPSGGQMARMAGFMRNGMGQHSNPQQQQRGQQLMRDMTRHLRGQDPSTGKK